MSAETVLTVSVHSLCTSRPRLALSSCVLKYADFLSVSDQ